MIKIFIEGVADGEGEGVVDGEGIAVKDGGGGSSRDLSRNISKQGVGKRKSCS